MSRHNYLLASDWLLWLNQNHSLVDSDQPVSATPCLSSTNSQLRLARSLITTLRVTFLHLSSPFSSISLRRSKNSPRAVLEATATQRHLIASFTHVSTPRKPLSEALSDGFLPAHSVAADFEVPGSHFDCAHRGLRW